MGRTSDAREKIVQAAQSLIEVRGYSALGVAEICTAARVPKGSFYHFFESKEALALAVIDAQWAAQQKTWAAILSGSQPPLERLRLLCEATEASQFTGQQGCGAVAGCMFGNLTLELSNQTEPIRTRLQQVFDTQASMVGSVIAEAAERGEATAGSAEDAARALVAQMEGQVMFAKLYNSTTPLRPLWDNCAALIGARGDGTAAARGGRRRPAGAPA